MIIFILSRKDFLHKFFYTLELTLEKVNVNCTNAPCIGTNYVDTKDCKIDVEASKLTVTSQTAPAVFLPAKGEATFTDCEITGGSAIEAVGLTTLNLKGTTKLVATAENYTAPTAASGYMASGSALLIVSHNGYNNSGTMTVNIDAGVTTEVKASDAKGYEVYQHSSGAGINKVEFKHKTDSFEYKDGTDSSCEVSTQKVSE